MSDIDRPTHPTRVLPHLATTITMEELPVAEHRDMRRRMFDEGHHPCRDCGGGNERDASPFLLQETDGPARWLDLCTRCANQMVDVGLAKRDLA